MSASALAARLLKASTIKSAALLSETDAFDYQTIQMPVYALNIACSGSPVVGYRPGLRMLCGPSKSFKSLYGLVMAKAYLDAHPESVMLFYDTEFGAAKDYFASAGIPEERVVHIPLINVEQLKFEVVKQLDEMKKDDKVFIFIDSVGNIASKKEIDDALDEKSVADLSRAKQLKSFYRMVTPYLNILKIPMVVINHSYKSQDMYPVDIVSGGSGGVYSSNDIWMIGKRQIKDSEGLQGFEFVINIEKSRSVKEKSKINISVTFDGGLNKFTGLFDIATNLGFITSPTQGWYNRKLVDDETGEIKQDQKWRKSDTDTKEFWDPLLNSKAFVQAVEKEFCVVNGKLIADEASA